MTLKSAFLVLLALQTLHSIEEYVGRLYDVFPPARAISGLISSDRERGFILFNVVLITFGAWCYLSPVRRGRDVARPLLWFWVGVELLNGVRHPAWSVMQRGYTPGVMTAVPLLLSALVLARALIAGAPAAGVPHNMGL